MPPHSGARHGMAERRFLRHLLLRQRSTDVQVPQGRPQRKVIHTLESLGFRMVREKEHISMIRANADGSNTPLTMPNHSRIKGSTLRSICTQAGITRRDFLAAFAKS